MLSPMTRDLIKNPEIKSLIFSGIYNNTKRFDNIRTGSFEGSV